MAPPGTLPVCFCTIALPLGHFRKRGHRLCPVHLRPIARSERYGDKRDIFRRPFHRN